MLQYSQKWVCAGVSGVVGVQRTVWLRGGLTVACPSSPGLAELGLESIQHFWSGALLQSHTADVFTVLWFFACRTFIHLRATGCYFIIRKKMDGCRWFCHSAERFMFNLMLYTYTGHLSSAALFTYVVSYFFIFHQSISFQSL